MKKPIVNLLDEKSGEAAVKRPIVNIWTEETGAAAAEYAMIVAVVGLGIGAASLALGGNIGWAGVSQSDALYNMNFEPGGGSGSSTGSSTSGGTTSSSTTSSSTTSSSTSSSTSTGGPPPPPPPPPPSCPPGKTWQDPPGKCK